MAKTIARTFEERRGFPGSIEVSGTKHSLMCTCNGNYAREMRKKKTIPVNVRAIQESHSECEQCGVIPWFVMPKAAGEKIMFDWRGKANKNLERDAA